jgi:hypothetical protein
MMTATDYGVVCKLNRAQGNSLRQRSMVVESRAYKLCFRDR